MHPILLKFGHITIYSYGVMVAIGFALAVFFIYRRASKFSLDREKCVDLTIWALIFGILGARALYVALNISFYAAHPIEIIMLSNGGLVWYGGFLSGLAAMIVYTGVNKLKFWDVVDLITPYIALAQSAGRIGCFLNGCCYGICNFPIQLVSSAVLFVIFIVLLLWQNRRRFAGEIALGYCVLYSSKRFIMEFFRGDNPKILYGLTMSQYVSAVIFIAGLAVFLYKVRQWKKNITISK